MVGRCEDVRRAKAFAQVDAAQAFVFHGCASIGEYGRRIGYGSQQAREYAAAGRVLAVCPAAEGMLLDGSLSVSTLAIVAPLLLEEDLGLRDEQGAPLGHEAILAWALTRSDPQLRRTVHRRREEVRTDAPTVARTVYLSSRGVEDLERTQTLVSRKEDRLVSVTEAVEHALRSYVEQHDLLEKKARARRSAPMRLRDDGRRNSRYVPAEVRRELMARHNDVCAIEFCEHRIWLENAHHVAHAAGGGNEVADQDRLCSPHHRMKDHGEIIWIPDAGGSGRGHYRTREGDTLRLKPPAGRDPSGEVRERAPSLRASRRQDPRAAPPVQGSFASAPRGVTTGPTCGPRVDRGTGVPGGSRRSMRPHAGDSRRRQLLRVTRCGCVDHGTR